MLYRHLLWRRSGWARQALQYHDRRTGNETRWSFQESEDSLSESEDRGASGLTGDYSQRVSVLGCWQLGCSSSPWLTFLLLLLAGIWILGRGSFYVFNRYWYKSTLMSNGLSKSFNIACLVSFSERLACSVGIFQSIPRESSKIEIPPSASGW